MPKTKTSPKRIISEQVDTFSGYEFEMTLAQLIEQAQRWITKYGPDARIDYSSQGFDRYDDSPGFQLLKNREETDAEYEKRINDERAHQAALDERERMEFERLNKKFGSKK